MLGLPSCLAFVWLFHPFPALCQHLCSPVATSGCCIALPGPDEQQECCQRHNITFFFKHVLIDASFRQRRGSNTTAALSRAGCTPSLHKARWDQGPFSGHPSTARLLHCSQLRCPRKWKPTGLACLALLGRQAPGLAFNEARGALNRSTAGWQQAACTARSPPIPPDCGASQLLPASAISSATAPSSASRSAAPMDRRWRAKARRDARLGDGRWVRGSGLGRGQRGQGSGRAGPGQAEVAAPSEQHPAWTPASPAVLGPGRHVAPPQRRPPCGHAAGVSSQ